MAELVKIMPLAVALGIGGANGWFARQDALSPDRAGEAVKQHSTWLQLGAIGLGVALNQRAMNARQRDAADALVYSGASLLASKVGVRVAASQEDPSPTGPLFAAQVHGQVFRPMVNGQFSRSPEERNLTRDLTSII